MRYTVENPMLDLQNDKFQINEKDIAQGTAGNGMTDEREPSPDYQDPQDFHLQTSKKKLQADNLGTVDDFERNPSDEPTPLRKMNSNGPLRIDLSDLDSSISQSKSNQKNP